MSKSFRTHKGDIVTGEILTNAFAIVAEDLEILAKRIRSDDEYASHVTEEQKDDNYLRGIELAQKVREGNVNSFAIWQRVNQVLTGECVAFLPQI